MSSQALVYLTHEAEEAEITYQALEPLKLDGVFKKSISLV